MPKLKELSENMVRIPRIAWVFLLVAGVTLTSAHHPTPKLEEGKIRTIVIDAGHGGHDPGALGSKVNEEDVTLGIAKELKRILIEKIEGIKVVMTREDDTFLELHKRAEHATEHDADFFVSIHCNSSSNKSAHGAETYVLGSHMDDAHLGVVMKENSSILLEDNHEEMYDGFDPTSVSAYIFFEFLADVHLKQSVMLAKRIQTQFTERVGRRGRGVKQAGFLVLWKASRPSILIETGFISNADEEKFLRSETGQVFLASAIYRAIGEYNATITE